MLATKRLIDSTTQISLSCTWEGPTRAVTPLGNIVNVLGVSLFFTNKTIEVDLPLNFSSAEPKKHVFKDNSGIKGESLMATIQEIENLQVRISYFEQIKRDSNVDASREELMVTLPEEIEVGQHYVLALCSVGGIKASLVKVPQKQ